MIWQSHWRQSNLKSGRSLIRAKNSDFPGKKFRWPFLFDHHKICRFPPKITKLPFTATFWVSCSVFLENRSHFQTDVLCKIAYNNISRPVHDTPVTSKTSSPKSGVATHQPPGLKPTGRPSAFHQPRVERWKIPPVSATRWQCVDIPLLPPSPEFRRLDGSLGCPTSGAWILRPVLLAAN